jgi:hypothetical protein
MTTSYEFTFKVGQKFYDGQYEVIKITPSFVTFRDTVKNITFRRKPIENTPHYYEGPDGRPLLSLRSQMAERPKNENNWMGSRWLDKEHCDEWFQNLLRTAPAPPRPRVILRTPAQVSIREARIGRRPQIPEPAPPPPASQ